MWILLALSSHASWGLVNVAEKYLLGGRVKSLWVFFLWTELVSLLTLKLFFFVPFILPEPRLILLLLVVAILYTIGMVLYFKAILIEEITRINLWWSLIPLFSLIISWLAIDERLSNVELLAMGVLLAGSALASLHFQSRGVVFSRAFLLMIVCCLAFASSAVILRYVTQLVPYSTVFGIVVGLRVLCSLPLLLMPGIRADFVAETKALTWPLALTVLGIAFLDYFGVFLNQWALSLAPAALVFSFEGFQILFVFAVVAIISRFRPDVLGEDLSVGNVVLKLASAALMIVGILILALRG